MDAAAELLQQGRYDEALEHYQWLWQNVPSAAPGLAGVRVSFMARSMGALATAHPPARARFSELRDRAALAADGDADPLSAARFDWLVLNEILAEPDRTMAWFDGVELQRTPAGRRSAFLHRLTPLLIERHRWADIGRLEPAPMATLARAHEILRGALDQPPAGPAARREAAIASLQTVVRAQVVVLYRGLMAAGRSEDAAMVREEALRRDDSPALRDLLARS